MTSIDRCAKAPIALVALASQLALFITIAAAECKQSIADLYDSKSPAVVRITALTINPYRMDDRVQQATASGFIVDTQGLVMTNSHVVSGPRRSR